MGKFGIGARVRDEDGDEGVIVGKPEKGVRRVQYDEPGGWRIDMPKSALTAIPLRLEIGKTYVDREGDQHGPLRFNPNAESFPFEHDGHCWNADGSWWMSGEHSMDLVAEVIAVGTAVTEEAPAEQPWEPKVGERVICLEDCKGQYTRGRVYEVREFYPDAQYSRIITMVDDAGRETNGWGTEQFAPFTLEAGKPYCTRDGDRVVVEDRGRYWATVENSDHNPGHYNSNGLSAYRGRLPADAHRAKFDIVGEWVEPEAVAEAVSTPDVTAITFKVGDKVDLIRDGKPVESWSGMTITEINRDDFIFPIKTDVGLPCFENELRLSPVHKFKVGDRVRIVRIVAGRGEHLLNQIGKTFTITAADGPDGSGWSGCSSENHFWWSEDELELVTGPAIGDKVTLTATVSGVSQAGVNVLFDDVPAAARSYCFPASALKAA